ncbi:MAG: hypothetical protein AAF441_20925 [Pseudomonadota bacterium]
MTTDIEHDQSGPYAGAFFLHVPKTAGSSICNMFAFTFDRFLRDAQSQPDEWRALLGGAETFFVGGHFSFAEAQDFLRRRDIFSFTALRDPYEQVVSHLKWVKAYGYPPRADKRAEIHPELADLAVRLWEVPLADVDEVKAQIDAPLRRLFFDVQTHYFCAPDANNVALAVANLQELTFFFTLDDMHAAKAHIESRVGELEEEKITNTAMIEEQVELQDPEIRAGYREMVALDLEFYEQARQISRDRFGIGP